MASKANNTENNNTDVETTRNKILTKKDITKLGYMSNFLQISFNYERMQAGGWLFSLLPFLKKIYKDDKEGLSIAMKDNLTFINTSPPLVSMLMGLLLSLEESKQDRSIINGLKNALFGPLAGIGDAIFWFTVLPIVAGISSSFAMQGSILGPLFFFVVYLGIFFAKIPLAHLGYNLGTKAIDWIQQYSATISNAATILGVTVVGGLIAKTVHINILSSFEFVKGQTFSVQTNFLDSIIPNLLPIVYTLLLYWLLKKKNVNPVWLILGTFVLAILLSFVGIL